jgi:PAS domain S-box-containing protein
MNPLNKVFPLHFTKRYLLFLTLVVTISYFILSIIILNSFTNSIKDRFGKELFAIALQLEANLPASYDEILEEHDALDKPAEEQIGIISSELKPIIQQLTYSHPDMGMGYYDLKLNRAVAKSSSTPSSLIREFREHYPAFNLYETGTPDLQFHNASPGLEAPVFYQTYPIYRNGNLIGHTWAVIRTENIYASALSGAIDIILAGITTLMVIISFSWYIFYRLGGDLKQFAYAVKNDTPDTSIAILPELNPLVDLVRSQKAALAKNYQQLQRLAFIVESSDDAIIGTTLDGIITSWNTGAEQIYGYTAEEAIGRSITITIPGDHSNEFLDILKKTQNGECVSHHETERIRKDGTLINVSVTISPIKDAQDKIVGISIIARDITDIKKYESEMARMDRLNLVGQMAAGIGHEIRNPMTTVRGFLQLLQNKDKDSSYAPHYGLMIDELDQANAIITEFLTLAKNKPSNLEKNNLNTLIQKIKPLIMSDAVKSKKTVNFHLEEIPDLLINEKEIRQLIFNLIRNAFEAVDQGGNVTISTYAQHNEVILAVQDDGHGIKPEAIDKVGTPFFTTKDNGTGLGLAVCYNIANRHNANIEIDTNSKGTTFFVRFKTTAVKH